MDYETNTNPLMQVLRELANGHTTEYYIGNKSYRLDDPEIPLKQAYNIVARRLREAAGK